MGSTNKTTNYELSQFIGTDKPSWLNDYDNDMLKIDTAIKNNATAAAGAQSTANTADGKADANAIAIGTLDTQINTPSTGLAAVVAENTSSIGTINGAIGNTALPTTAQTITGAIDELDTDITTGISGINTKLTGVLAYIGDQTFESSSDGVKTIGTQINELITAVKNWISNNPTLKFEYNYIILRGVILTGFSDRVLHTYDNFYFDFTQLSTAAISMLQVSFFDSGNAKLISWDGSSGTDLTSEVAASSAYLIIKVYKTL